MEKDWTKEFRNKLEDWQQPAPEGLWEAVSSDMGVAQRRRPVWKVLGWAGGVAAAAAIVAAVLHFGFRRGQVDGSDVSLLRESYGGIIAQVITEGDDKEEAHSGESTMAMPLEVFGEGSGEVPGKDFRFGERKLTEVTEEEGVSGETEEMIFNEDSTEENLAGEEKGNPEKEAEESPGDETVGDERKKPAGDERDEAVGDAWKEIVDDGVKAGRSNRGNVRIGAVVCGGNGGNSHLDGYAGTTAATGMVNAFGENPQADIMLFNRTREVSTDTKYFQPIRAGVSVKWNFSGRWGLESGLYWSGLYSRTTSGSENYFTRSRQELHYLGIPLNLTCDIWSGKGFTVYATAGGMLEKCVGGRVRTEYFYNNTSAAPESSAISEKELQWSAGVNFGAEYLFSKHIGLYLEPGVVWHFNNDSPIDNVYKARPFDFNLSLGLRFAF